MPNFTAGTSFTDGVTNDVTAAKLNALIADAVPTSSLSLNSTTGTISQFSSGTGTAASPAIQPTGDTNTGIFFPAADTIAFSEGGTESMRIDSSGRVGIGASPNSSYRMTIKGDSSGVNTGVFFSGASSSFEFSEAGNNTSDVQLWNYQNGYLRFATNNTERLRIDSSGNVGIGTTSPTSKLDIKSANAAGAIQLTATTGTNGSYANFVNSSGAFIIGKDSSTGNNLVGAPYSSCLYSQGAYPMIFCTDSTERLRITSGGEVCVGTTTAQGQFTSVRSINGSNIVAQSTNASFTDNVCLLYADRNTSNSSYNFFGCTRTGVATVFAIRDSGNAVNTNNSYGAISDIKLKENIEDASSQWNDIKSIQVRKFSFKNDEEHKRMLGLVAQEVELISPHLVETVIDRDKDGNDLGTTTKEVKYSVLYMKAVKALQEAMDRIEQLEAKVTALEAA